MPSPTREQVTEALATRLRCVCPALVTDDGAHLAVCPALLIDDVIDVVMVLLDRAPCPYVETSGTTSFCRLAEAPQPKVLARGRTNGLRLSSGCTFDERINVPPGTPVAVIEDTETDRDG